MSGQGSGGNVLAALCSFIIPGLGQLLQGRLGMAIFMHFLGWVVWFGTAFLFGWVINMWSAVDAARFIPPRSDEHRTGSEDPELQPTPDR
jgi:hypothetical protein